LSNYLDITEQWTSFSDLGKFPLVLDPVVAGSQLIQVLINDGSGLILLLMCTLKKIGLDISKMLTPREAPFYGIVGLVVLPVTFGMEYIKFEVADFESS
jgi:hypothetical protein